MKGWKYKTSVKSKADCEALIATYKLPEGWHVEPHIVRQYPLRNEWDLVALCEGKVGHRWTHIYDVRAAMFVIQRWLEEHDTATYDGMEVPVR